MNGPVLVTGAAGFIGGHIVRTLAREGIKVLATDSRSLSFPALDAVRTLRIDVGDPALVDRVRAGEFTAVLHQAAISDTLDRRWPLIEHTNVTVPFQLAQACATSETLFVYASSASVYGSIKRKDPVSEEAVNDPSWCTGPLNPYAKSKLMLDVAMLERSDDLQWVGLRYTNVFGPGEFHKGHAASMLFKMLLSTAELGQVELFSDTLAAARDWVPVAHVAETTLRILQNPICAGVYNLGSGHAISFSSLAQWCADFRHDGHIELALTPNFVSAYYQYWTCAEMAALRSKVPDLPVLDINDIYLAAKELYVYLEKSDVHRESNENRNKPTSSNSFGSCRPVSCRSRPQGIQEG
ncbi:NAD-dependent epimerase/dehydratase family protein [Actinoallomurus sp. CA-142502]|uniref:NAD-dependent epimerase/dehydratase family protein n=1 Tax=Actinoallomurus sp. CA-142502 TaxID=3239885 RepID=UPI003D8CBDD3